MASPAFRALRRSFPNARITLQLREALLPVVAGAPWFDEVAPLHSHRRGLRAQWRDARMLRALARRHGPFDLGLCLPDSFSAAWLMRLAGVRRVVGYRRALRMPLLHRAVKFPPPPLPEEGAEAPAGAFIPRERHTLALACAAGATPYGVGLECFTTPAEREGARAQLAAHAIAPDARYALLAPGASFGPSKCWPAEYFAAAGRQLAAAGLRVGVIGTAQEHALCARVAAGMQAHNPALLAGALTLGELKAAVAGAQVLVANDAGARHLAAALRVPCVVQMGPTALEKTGLNLRRTTIHTSAAECRPCYRRVCPIDHRCMRGIPPAAVAAEALRAATEGAAFRGRQHQFPAFAEAPQ